VPDNSEHAEGVHGQQRRENVAGGILAYLYSVGIRRAALGHGAVRRRQELGDSEEIMK
jgi:hypothetical protein